ncbi:uncharacterized protein BT62DRAFT_1005358 [Guyanagaster necrorhizus]|uniref:Uncharacterized protein n=1 Tax=Guyanagaster necrorhizus TaxID=856835 RepID=A0A9P8AT94_9AGAR|nr:uncharacterized protein BT62DRAFT_1005358 [Guyanagaster necrorhizus MCA 3950]KAG7446960.1 hypothetical protein BT62DRAFT_1005358 [Guyanagaster necrorhizus MCA 3950]
MRAVELFVVLFFVVSRFCRRRRSVPSWGCLYSVDTSTVSTGAMTTAAVHEDGNCPSADGRERWSTEEIQRGRFMGVGHRASGTRQFNGEGFPPAHEDPSIVVAYEPLRVILNRLAHSIFVLKGRVELEEQDVYWDETFNSGTDSKSKGPEFLSLYIVFPNHGTRIALLSADPFVVHRRIRIPRLVSQRFHLRYTRMHGHFMGSTTFNAVASKTLDCHTSSHSQVFTFPRDV